MIPPKPPEQPPAHMDFEALSAYVDGELSPAETAAVEARLTVSAEARATVVELRSLKDALARSRVPRLTDVQATTLLRAVRRELGVEPAPGSPRAGRHRLFRTWMPVAVGAAAVLAGVVVVPQLTGPSDDEAADATLESRQAEPTAGAFGAAAAETTAATEALAVADAATPEAAPGVAETEAAEATEAAAAESFAAAGPVELVAPPDLDLRTPEGLAAFLMEVSPRLEGLLLGATYDAAADDSLRQLADPDLACHRYGEGVVLLAFVRGVEVDVLIELVPVAGTTSGGVQATTYGPGCAPAATAVLSPPDPAG